jgi:hypothetical protein
MHDLIYRPVTSIMFYTERSSAAEQTASSFGAVSAEEQQMLPLRPFAHGETADE